MSAGLFWEPHGVVRRYWGHLTPAEWEESLEEMRSDSRYDSLRYEIADFSRVSSHSLSRQDVECAVPALQEASRINPGVTKIAVSNEASITRLLVLGRSFRITAIEMRVVQTLAEARTLTERLAEQDSATGETPSVQAVPTNDAEDPIVIHPVLKAVRSGNSLDFAIQQETLRLGFDRFSFRRCRVGSYGVTDNLSTFGQVLPSWHRAYEERRLAAIDPRFQLAARSAIPEVWYRGRFQDTPAMREFFDTADSFGVGAGVCLVVFRPEPSLVDFFHAASSNPVVDEARKKQIVRTLPELWSIATYGYANGVDEALANDMSRADSLLTARQVECLERVAAGLTSRQIAEELGISDRTVDAHVGECVQRLQAKNRSEAVARAFGARLIYGGGSKRFTTRRSTPDRANRRRDRSRDRR